MVVLMGASASAVALGTITRRAVADLSSAVLEQSRWRASAEAALRG